MTQPFTLTSRLSRRKYANLSLQLAFKTNLILDIIVLVGIWWILGAFHDFYRHPEDLNFLNVLFELLPGFCILLYPLRKWYHYRFEYDQIYPQLRREIEFTFLEDGFVVRAPDGEAKIEWKEVSTLDRAGGFFIFVLRHDNGTYYVDSGQLSREQKQYINTRFFYRFW